VIEVDTSLLEAKQREVWRERCSGSGQIYRPRVLGRPTFGVFFSSFLLLLSGRYF
jgi:hypothetical protein